MNISKPININKPDLLIISTAIVIALIFSVFQFVMFSEASTPNPGHSAAEIGSGTFGEVGSYIFPGASNVGIGVASPSYNLDVEGTGHFTNPVIVAEPIDPNHIATKSYVLSVLSATCIDNDGDGYGDPGDASCPNGEETDCDDNNILIYPGRTEICDNGVDDDCDTDTDCDDSECVGDPHCVVSCIDNDGDGYGVCPNCDIVNGCTHDGDDCCDSDANVYPGQTKYFSSINNCGNWDYDCNKTISKSNCSGSSCETTGYFNCFRDDCTSYDSRPSSCDISNYNVSCGESVSEEKCIDYPGGTCYTWTVYPTDPPGTVCEADFGFKWCATVTGSEDTCSCK